MKLFSTIMNDEKLKAAYILEKQTYIDLLKDRADIFVSEAKEVGLEIYPHVEGFFVTIKVADDLQKELLNKKLQKNNIFMVEADHGLRVAICSVPKRKLKGLAKRIKELM
jgi:aspartate/tyrosine/aromatic aminotransferase